jgi:hypothetical protein
LGAGGRGRRPHHPHPKSARRKEPACPNPASFLPVGCARVQAPNPSFGFGAERIRAATNGFVPRDRDQRGGCRCGRCCGGGEGEGEAGRRAGADVAGALRRPGGLREAPAVPVQGGGRGARADAPADAVLPPRRPQPHRPLRPRRGRCGFSLPSPLPFFNHRDEIVWRSCLPFDWAMAVRFVIARGFLW